MIKAIQDVLNKGAFTGCNITFKQSKEDTLHAILSFQLPNEPDLIQNHKDDAVNKALDTRSQLRSSLTTPIVVTATSASLSDAINAELKIVTEQLISASQVLGGSDIKSLIADSLKNVKSPAKGKSETKAPEIKPSNVDVPQEDDLFQDIESL
jgi:hypothetical protein